MKTIATHLLTAVAYLIASSMDAGATTNSLYAVNISASLSTETVSGSTYSIHTTHVSNHSIVEAILATGTAGTLKPSGLAVVFNNEAQLEVINTANGNVVALLAETGSNAVASAIASGSLSKLSAVETTNDYEFTLPGVANVIPTSIRLTAKIDQNAETLSRMLITFSGGQGTLVPGATCIQGTIRQTGKVYP